MNTKSSRVYFEIQNVFLKCQSSLQYNKGTKKRDRREIWNFALSNSDLIDFVEFDGNGEICRMRGIRIRII